MKKTFVKICGLRRPQDAEAANRARSDFAGMILSPGFRRSIDLETACALRRILDPEIRTVGVFVDAPLEDILSAAKSRCIDVIQLHGQEDDAFIRSVLAETGLPVIKAFRISEKKDLEAAAASAAPWILLDSGTGTGKTFDWDLLETFLQESVAGRENARQTEQSIGLQDERRIMLYYENPEKDPSRLQDDRFFPGGHPWLLAGGLSAENVASAVLRFHPTGVDVSSKVETDGWKDPGKMEAFTRAAQNAMNREQGEPCSGENPGGGTMIRRNPGPGEP